MAADNPKPELLITGAGGGLGRQVVSRLKKHYEIVGVDFRWRKYVDQDIVNYMVDFNKRDFEDVFRNHNFKGIIHLGRIESDENTRYRRFSSNVLGTEKLFHLSLKYHAGQILVLSSHYVYGADPYNPVLLTEDSPLKASELTTELADSVELENLSSIYLYKHPSLNITILRPCTIAGPGVRNNMCKLMSQAVAPCIMGFSPMMQFIHVADMAEAISIAYQKNNRGIYNVAPMDWVAYQDALEMAGCSKLQLPPVPPGLPRRLARMMGRRSFPNYLINYFKYPVIIDGRKFEQTFDFMPRHNLREIFRYYRRLKKN